MVEQHLTRRGLLRLAAGSAAAALLAACGGSSATNTPSGAAKATALPGGTGGQTPAPVVTSAPATSGSAAAATKPAGSAAAATTPAGSAAAGTSGLVAPPASTPNAVPKGNVRYWQTTYDPATVPSAKYHDQWITYLKTALPNVVLKEEQYAYNNDLLDKIRVADRAGQGPDVAVMPILWGPEFAYGQRLLELNLADFGYTADKFWPGALKSITVNGKLYGIPTNNETLAFVYNKDIFQKAGLDPNKGPGTWEDVKTYAKQIKDKTGKAGYGLVAQLNAGNTPFRYMPLCWAYGGAALDETADNPTYQKSGFDSAGNIAALQWVLDVYSGGLAPQSSLTNTQTEVRALFISGEVAMMIGSPGEFAAIKAAAPDVAAKMNYVLMPTGPVRRAIVFGGSNIAIFKSAKDVDAAKAIVKARTQPDWALRLIWEGSNPGHRDGFLLPEEKVRESQTPFLDVTIQMLQYGISFPTVPEASDIMNLYVPQMMQDVMTKAKTPQQSGQDTAKKINDLIAKRK
ncbi:MAG: ABC transporter substrate-binding protein [Thermomicrobiales bacterium]